MCVLEGISSSLKKASKIYEPPEDLVRFGTSKVLLLHNIPLAPVLQMGPPGFIKDGSGFPKTRVLIQILNICHVTNIR